MARGIQDVLDQFLPEPDSGGASAKPARSPALGIVSLPVSNRDVVRAAFAWNLVVEVARLGGHAILVSPARDTEASLWPDQGLGPLGAEVVLVEAEDLGALEQATLDIAQTRASESDEGGVVLARIPPLWLRKVADGTALLQNTLLMTSAEPRDLLETYGIAKLLFANSPSCSVGVTVHGAESLEAANEAFRHLDEVSTRRLGHPLANAGALVDDLHVYRAIVARRPIGLAHPQSDAARSLGNVARWLFHGFGGPADG